MKKLKLGFCDTHDHIKLFFSSLLATRYDLELDDTSPDYLIFGDENFGSSNSKFSKDDCIKIFYTGENQRPENYDCHYAISFDHNFNPWHYRLPLFVIYMWSLDKIHNTGHEYFHILNKHSPKQKTGFASFVVSNPNNKFRNNFFLKLNEIKAVDSGGKLYNNIGKQLQGEMEKIDFLSKRKFNICFEPYSHPGYLTEKILHAFYAETLPIYWGSTTIASDFNPGAFIDVNNFSSMEEAIEYVMHVDSDHALYSEYMEQPKLLDNIPRDYMMLTNFLNWFDSIVYNKIEMRS